MNLFFKSLVIRPRSKPLFSSLKLGHLTTLCSIVVVMFLAPKAWSLNLNAIYTAACEREIGVILAVDDSKIKFLNIKGKLIEIRPHEIIYLAYYPMDHFPILVAKANLSKVSKILIKTEVGAKIKNLVHGWPIGFTKEKVSFLLPSGSETVIKRKNIFSIKFQPGQKSVRFARNSKSYNFVHPYAFKNCPDIFNGKNNKPLKRVKVYPQQVLSQPVMIKRELDHLKAGYQLLRRYEKEQDFYPVPEVYKNSTTLGLWHSEGSRYGASKKRPNNITPVLTDAYSSDVFDYQHIFITGSAPMPFAIHEEPQTFAYYRFKASYFHFSAMADPSLILVGQNYKWKTSDMSQFDDRINPSGMLEMGFDFGPLTLDLYLADNIQVGLRSEGEFFQTSVNVPRTGLSYRNHLWAVSGSFGSGSEEEGASFQKEADVIELTALRLNFTTYYFKSTEIMLSFINRVLDFTSEQAAYASQSNTGALYFKYQSRSRLRWGGFLAIESHSNDYSLNGGSDADENLYPKGGGYVAISF